jgi:hypothetical protein
MSDLETQSIDSYELMQDINETLKQCDTDEYELNKDNTDKYTKLEYFSKYVKKRFTKYISSDTLHIYHNSINNIISRFNDMTVFKIHLGMSCFASLFLIYLYILFKRTSVLFFFLIGSLSINIRLNNSLESFNETYFIHSCIYYFALSFYSVIANIYYGDTLFGLIRLMIFTSIPVLYSAICLFRLRQINTDDIMTDDIMTDDIMTDDIMTDDIRSNCSKL